MQLISIRPTIHLASHENADPTPTGFAPDGTFADSTPSFELALVGVFRLPISKASVLVRLLPSSKNRDCPVPGDGAEGAPENARDDDLSGLRTLMPCSRR